MGNGNNEVKKTYSVHCIEEYNEWKLGHDIGMHDNGMIVEQGGLMLLSS